MQAMNDDGITLNQLEIGDHMSMNHMNSSTNDSTNGGTILDSRHDENDVAPLLSTRISENDGSRNKIRKTVCFNLCYLRTYVIAIDAFMVIAMTLNLPLLIVHRIEQLRYTDYFPRIDHFFFDDHKLDISVIMYCHDSYFLWILIHICSRIVYISIGLYGAIRYQTNMIQIAEMFYLIDGIYSILFTEGGRIYGFILFTFFVSHSNFAAEVTAAENRYDD